MMVRLLLSYVSVYIGSYDDDQGFLNTDANIFVVVSCFVYFVTWL